MSFKKRYLLTGVLTSLISVQSMATDVQTSHQGALTLEKAIYFAQLNDPWLVQSTQQEQSILAKSTAAGTLPDPKLSVSLANLPTDGFDFDQEAMTQLKFGYSQMLPAGNSLEIKAERLKRTAGIYPHLRNARLSNIERDVGKLWLDVFMANKSIELINQNQDLFAKLVDVAQASYSSATGKTSQQDIVRAQLELTLLQERLSGVKQEKEASYFKLKGWIDNSFTKNYLNSEDDQIDSSSSQANFPLTMPGGSLQKYAGVFASKLSASQITNALQVHPEILALDQKVAVKQSGVDLANESYKPDWGLNASYAYRDDDPLGGDRADFISIGVSVELPIFSDTKQDQNLKSAKMEVAASKTHKWQKMREMLSAFQRQNAEFQFLAQREERYKKMILPKISEQAEAALNAYTNDEGDFAEVVRARIAELNAKIDALEIAVKKQQAIFEINYFLAGVR